MTKEIFIKHLTRLLQQEDTQELFKEDYPEIMDFWNKFIGEKTVGGVTAKGKEILRVMQEHYQDCNNSFSSKQIGEYLNTSGKTVSGSMKKLITDDYVEKISQNPVLYALTDNGKAFTA